MAASSIVWRSKRHVAKSGNLHCVVERPELLEHLLDAVELRAEGHRLLQLRPPLLERLRLLIDGNQRNGSQW